MWIGALGFAVSDIHTQSKLSTTKHIWDLQEHLLTLHHSQTTELASVIMWFEVPVGASQKTLFKYEHTAEAMVSLPITATRTEELYPIQSYVADLSHIIQRLVRK